MTYVIGGGKLSSTSSGIVGARTMPPTQVKLGRCSPKGVRIHAALKTKTSEPISPANNGTQPAARDVTAAPLSTKEPPSAGPLFVIKFLLDSPKALVESFEKHGKVFTVNVLGNKLYALGGGAPLRKFYDPDLVRRFPEGTPKLFSNAWLWKGGYAIPPLDGVAHKMRKSHLINTITSRESAEKYLAALDPLLTKAFNEAGRDGPFSWFQLVAKTYLTAASKQFFGYSIAEYGNADAMVTTIFDAFDIFNEKLTVKKSTKEGYKAACTYFEAVLAKYRADPDKYKDTGLARYFADPAAAEFCDGEIVLDMHQVFVNGSNAIVMVTMCMGYMLCKRPDILAKLREEVKDVKEVSFDSLRKLPYTFAFFKEIIRYYPQVFVVAGTAVREFEAEGYRVPEGASLLALLHATGFDPNVHENAHEFQPERFLPPRSEGESDPTWEGWAVAFGAGDSLKGHSCGGKYVAVTLCLDICVRMVQAWKFEMVNPQEKLKQPGFGALPEKGLQLRRV